MPKIPEYIINEETRKKLVEINQHISTLKSWHDKFMEKLSKEKLSPEEAELLRKIITAHNNLHSQFNELAPSLAEAVRRFYEDN